MAQIAGSNVLANLAIGFLLLLTCTLDVTIGTPCEGYDHTIDIPINNYLLYQLGISQPGNVIGQNNVLSIFEKTFTTHKVDATKVEPSSVVSTVVPKLKNMLFRYRKCKGGRSKKKLVESWKTSNYTIKVKYKTDSPTKRKLEEVVEKERRKHKKSVEKVKQAERQIEALLSEKRALQRQIEIIQNPQKQGKRGRAKKKLEYSKSHRRRLELNRIKAVKEYPGTD